MNESVGKSRLWRPPLIGVVTTILMLFAVGLAHAVMRLIEQSLGHDMTYIASIGIGFLGILLLWSGVRSRSESYATWVGFLAGLTIWMSWVEFFYMYYGRKNFGMLPRMVGDQVTTEPE